MAVTPSDTDGAPGAVRIGISGWRYRPWRGVFYPPGLAQRRELEFAAERFATIEINGSFYCLQRASSWRAWAEQSPPDFVFAVKGSRYITHMLKLREARPALANFFASGVLELGSRLGPFLWQFPPRLAYDPERLSGFIRILPRDTIAALRLAREHDDRVREPFVPARLAKRPLRHAFEVRHESFRDPSFVALLRRHRIALVVADTAGKWPLMEEVTADFMYLRLHGDKELYASGYSAAAISRWAEKIVAWCRGRPYGGEATVAAGAPLKRVSRDVYCYFDNDVKTHAPFDAQALAKAVHARLGRACHPETV